MRHEIAFNPRNYQGYFSRNRAPILTVRSGDTVVATSVPDAGWGVDASGDPDAPPIIPREQRVDPDHDTGHCLVGPIAVEGALPGQVLQVDVLALMPGDHGATWVGPFWEFLPQLGVTDRLTLAWRIDRETGIATSASGRGVALAPFLGVMGNAPPLPGIHPTPPPRAVGGNIDCKALTVGASLFLPIAVPGALFAFGDGHAAQGDGEISGTAIECGMDHVELRLTVRDDLSLDWPRARTDDAWLTFGFDRDLTTATVIALNGMLDLMTERLGVTRAEAVALASVAVDLRITQIANRVLGVHAIWPHDRLSA